MRSVNESHPAKHVTESLNPPAFGSISLLATLVLIPCIALILIFDFNGLYGQDPYAYYRYAMGPLRQALFSLDAPPPFFWPPGYPLLVSVTSLVLGTAPWVAQGVSLVAAASVPVGVFLLAQEFTVRDVRHSPVPWVAGVGAGLSGMLWFSGVVAMSDTAALAFATFGVWSIVRSHVTSVSRHAVWWAVCGAALLGVATMTRLVYGLLMAVATVYLIMTWYANRDRASLWITGLVIITYSVIIAPLWIDLLLRPATNAAFTGSFAVHTWNPLNAARRSFEGIDGFRTYRLPNGLYYGSTFARGFYFTPLLAPFLLVGLWQIVRQRTRHDIVLLVGWPFLFFAYLVGDEYQNARFTLAALPPMAIVLAVGIRTAREYLQGAWRRRLEVWTVIGMTAMVVGGVTQVARLAARKQIELDTVRWALAQIPADAQILTFGLTQTFEFEADQPVFDLFVLATPDVASLSAERATYVVLNSDNVRQQWSRHAPGLNYSWLRDARGLDSLGQMRGYTLFRVRQN